MKLPKYKYFFGRYEWQITVTDKNKERAAEICQDARDDPKFLYGQDMVCGKGIDDLIEKTEGIECNNKRGYWIDVAWEAVKGLNFQFQDDRWQAKYKKTYGNYPLP